MRNARHENYSGIFDARGSSYDTAMRRWPDARQFEFKALIALSGVKAGDALCDFPSGGGYVSPYLPAGVTLTQVEKSNTFHHISHGVLADGNKVPLPDGSFDAIISMAGLHHDDDQKGFFRECARLLKKGGTLCVADVLAGSPPAHFLDRFVDRHCPGGHEGLYFGPHTLGDVAAAGLTVTQAEVISYPWIFDTEEDAGAFCATLFGMHNLSPANTVIGLRDHLNISREDGKVLMDWGLFFIKATK